MAYELLTDEQKKLQDQPTVAKAQTLIGEGGQSTLSSGTGGAAGASGEQLQAQQAKATIPGGGVMDINKYLDVNKQKSQALADKLAGGITTGGETARTGIAGAGTQWEKDVGAGTIGLNQDVYGRAKEALTGAPGTGGTLNAPDTEEFKRMYGATYQGPTDITQQQYYTDAQKAAAEAQATAKLAETPEGRKELLARQMAAGGGRYSKGAMTLDQSLLAADPEAMARLKAAETGTSDIADKLAALQSLGQTAVQKGQQTTADTRAAMQKEFDISREQGELSDAAKAEKQRLEGVYQNYLQNTMIPMGEQEGVRASNYFQRDPYSNINQYNIASQQDYARLQALAGLTGQQNVFAPYANQAGGAGQYQDPSKFFNQGQFQTDVENARQTRLAAERQRAAAAQAAAEAQAASEEANRQSILERAGAFVANPVLGIANEVVNFVGGGGK
jgi:hypothetical protein